MEVIRDEVAQTFCAGFAWPCDGAMDIIMHPHNLIHP
jgi:hypothetical protein